MFTATLADLEGSTFLVVLDEVALVQLSGCSVYEISPPLVQQSVLLKTVRVNTVELRSSQHANVQVGVTWEGGREGGKEGGIQ